MAVSPAYNRAEPSESARMRHFRARHERRGPSLPKSSRQMQFLRPTDVLPAAHGPGRYKPETPFRQGILAEALAVDEVSDR